MSKKAIKITAIVIAMIFVLGIVGPLAISSVFSEPDKDIDEIREEKALTLEGINRLEIELNKADNDVRLLNEKIEESTKELEELKVRLVAAEELEDKIYNESARRFRIMCEKGMVSYLDIVFSATSFSDFTDRLVIATELAEYDKNMMKSIAAVRKEIADNKENTERVLKEQEDAMVQLVSAKDELTRKKAEAQKTLQKLQSDEKAYLAYLERKKAEEDALKNQYAGANGNVVKPSNGKFVWPTTSTWITSNFAPSRVNPVSGKLLPHTGTDIGAASGEPVYATASGTVTFAGVNGGYGNCIIVNHGNGVSSLYAHLSAIETSTGKSVTQGQKIGRVGSTGNSTGPHLHFEIIVGGTPSDPMQYF